MSDAMKKQCRQRCLRNVKVYLLRNLAVIIIAELGEPGENRFPKEKRPSMTLVTADSKRASTES